MSVTFGPPISVWFPSDFLLIPALYAEFPTFNADILPPSSTVLITYVVGYPQIFSVCGHGERARDARTRGGGGLCRWRKILRGYVHKIILARNLLRQSEDQSRVPVRFLVPQGTGEAISAYHAGLQPRNHDWDPALNPATHMQNGFVHFCCH